MNSTTNTEISNPYEVIGTSHTNNRTGKTDGIFNHIEIPNLDENVLQDLQALAPLSNAQTPRPQGESKRKYQSAGATFWFINCPCGKSSGNKYDKKAFNLWIRLHKKRCSAQ